MRLKKISIIAMSAVLVFGSTPLAALAEDNSGETKTESGKYSAKDEAIYGNLDAGGTLKDLYVVNTFHVTEPGKITDRGDYTDVRNLSNLNEIEQTENKIRFQAEDEEFYYQGEMDNRPLPWNIDITYMLDGEEVTPEQLIGQSGSLEIQIATSANESVDPVFFENYLLQISLTLDPSKANNIQAPDGTKANSGKDTQVTFTGMPDEAEEFILTAEVENFEMNPIDISGAPFSMSMEDPDISGMKNDMQSLSDAISEIDQGVAGLNNGIAELSNGASDLSKGSRNYQSGINDLNASSSELVNGSSEIRDALNEMNKSVQGSSGAPDLSELEALPGGLRELAEGLRESAEGLDTLKQNYENANGKLDKALNGISQNTISPEQIKALKEKIQSMEDSGAHEEVVNKLVKSHNAAKKAKETYNEVKKAFGSVTGTLNEVSSGIREMAKQAETTASEIEKGMAAMDEMEGLTQLQEGISSLSSQYQSFHNGLGDYTDGVGSLASSYGELNSGIQEFANGASSLNSGASELKNGTEELEERTSDMPSEMQSEVDKMMDEYDASDFKPQSFVSDQNGKVEVVQFVLKTEAIEAEEPEAEDETEGEKKGFWDRLMDLFR